MAVRINDELLDQLGKIFIYSNMEKNMSFEEFVESFIRWKEKDAPDMKVVYV